MKNSKTVLIVSISEIYHNPRLIKAADEFHENGYNVVIQDIILGNISRETYNNFIKNKPWKVYSIDISKKSIGSKINFYICSIFNLIAKTAWNFIRAKLFHKYYLAKGLLLYKDHCTPHIIYTNVIDALPFCAALKNKHHALLCFDSQELFSGQYQNSNKNLYEWVLSNEKKHINNADIVLTTTNIMGKRIKELYPKIPLPIRVRNLPNKHEEIKLAALHTPVRLIWHGYAVYLESRGIKLIIDGIKLCKTDVLLTLQGHISENEKLKILNYIGNKNKVVFTPQAPVGKIVQSILNYDIGVIGEQAENENQLYTSSNKLFDYLHAGLPILSTNMPGLTETIDQANVGLIYTNALEFSQCIEKLVSDQSLFMKIKNNSITFAQQNTWKDDFKTVISKLDILLNNHENPR